MVWGLGFRAKCSAVGVLSSGLGGWGTGFRIPLYGVQIWEDFEVCGEGFPAFTHLEFRVYR